MKLLILVAAQCSRLRKIHRSIEPPKMNVDWYAYEWTGFSPETHCSKDGEVFIIQCSELLSFLPFGGMECQQIAHGKIPKIKEFLESGTAAKDVCSKLKAC
ncbi:surfactant protein B [Ostertagia ostertagi]